VEYIQTDSASAELVIAFIGGLLFGPLLSSFFEQLFMHLGIPSYSFLI